MRRSGLVIGTMAFFLMGTGVVMADRGGWADPEGGWTFVEEFDELPDYEPTEDSVWLHDNSSDQYSGNQNTAIFQENGWEGGEVARIDEIDGANVITLIDLGDPRDWTGGDPSDRKFHFTHVFHGEDEAGIEMPISTGGITMLTRYRMTPLDLSTPFQDDNDWADPPFNFAERAWIPEQYDKCQVAFGYGDPIFTDLEAQVGVGYYAENSLFIQSNTLNEDGTEKDPDDGSGNILIKDGINTTEFHSIWWTAITSPDDPYTVNVKAWLDGSAEPVAEGVIMRGPDYPDTPAIDSEGGYGDFPQTCIQFGMCATNNYGSMQVDYICCNPYEAIEPQGGAAVADWSLH